MLNYASTAETDLKMINYFPHTKVRELGLKMFIQYTNYKLLHFVAFDNIISKLSS